MRAIVRSVRAAHRRTKPRARRLCVFCGREIGASVVLCGRCRSEYAPSAIDCVVSWVGIGVDEIARRADVSKRTVIRARQRERIGKRSAKALALALNPRRLPSGIQASRFLVDADDDDEERAA
jgi:hypothetical protein